MQETDLTALVSEQHEIFTHDSDSQRQLTQFFRQRNTMPKSTQVLPTRRTGADMRQFSIFAWPRAFIVTGKTPKLFYRYAHSPNLQKFGRVTIATFPVEVEPSRYTDTSRNNVS